MFVSSNRQIKEIWTPEIRKECNSIRDEIILTMQTKGKTVHFEGEDMNLEGEDMNWTEKQIENASKKVVRKNDSNSTEERK